MEAKNVDTQGIKLDFGKLLDIVRKNIVTIILSVVILAVGFYVYSKFFIPKQYEASATLIVNNLPDETNVVNNSEITAAQNLAKFYSIIIKSDNVLDTVIKNLGLNTKPETLKSSIDVSTVNSTQIISISMRHTKSSYAKEVVAEILNVAPDVIKKEVKVGSVKVVSKSRISNGGAPVSPNSFRNGMIGGLIGLVLSLAFVFVRELSNNTFKTEDDIAQSLGIPLLGIIPSVDTKEFNKNV